MVSKFDPSSKFFYVSSKCFLLILFGVGMKFKLYPSNLNCALVKDLSDKFITCPNGSDLCLIVLSIACRRRL